MKGLTKKQKKIVDFIGAFSNTMGMAPTIYEIAEHFGIKTSTVFAHIRALQKKSALQRSSKARSISLAKPVKRKNLPAGAQSIPVLESNSWNEKPVPGKNLVCDTKLFRNAIGEKDIFAIHITGKDFEPFGVLDGDMLLIKNPSNAVVKGDLLLTEGANGKAQLSSCLDYHNGIFELQSGGKNHVKVSKNDLPLRGIVVGLQRSL